MALIDDITAGFDVVITRVNTLISDLSGKADTSALADKLSSSNNLSDLVDAPTSRGNIGLGASDNVSFSDLDASGSITAGAIALDGAALTSSTAITWDASTNSQPTLDLNHLAVVTVTNLADNQTISMSGTAGLAARSLTIAHAGLTLRVMNGALSDIDALAENDLFEVTIKRTGTDLRCWFTTLTL